MVGLKTGLSSFLCSVDLNFCSDFGIFLDLPISFLIIDLQSLGFHLINMFLSSHLIFMILIQKVEIYIFS